MKPESKSTCARSPEGPGTLYICGTPIGNLQDISDRARHILGAVYRIAAEDTRHTRKLLTAYGIKTPLFSLHEHNEVARTEEVLEMLRSGHDIALVSDAGMPGISDPGAHVVNACIGEKIPVIPVPGPAAFLTALVASGLPTDRFTFEGFLPRKAAQRDQYLAQIKGMPHTLIFYEAPHRLERTLKALMEALGNRRAVLARELTKMHEEFIRGTLSDLLDWCQTGPVRGEMVILVEGAREEERPEMDEAELRQRLHSLLKEGVSVRDAVRRVVQDFGLSRSLVYDVALQIREDQGSE